MSGKFKLRFQSAIWLVLATIGSLGLAGCAIFEPRVWIYVDGEVRDHHDQADHERIAQMIDGLFIERSAIVNGQNITYYVDRSEPTRIYTMRQDKRCNSVKSCDDRRYFAPPEEPLRQQLLELEAVPHTPTRAPDTPELPSVLPDTRIILPTLPPVPLPQD
jgi:hypothetical protein